ncbi:MAG: glycolate oxidase subunit GlcE [Pseudomonadota bacterium]
MSAFHTPSDERSVSEAVRAAKAAGLPLEISGGTSRAGLGCPVQAEATLSTRGLDGIELYEPGALCLVVKAGTPLKTVEEVLGAENQRLPFEPMDHRALFGAPDAEPTIGGIVACGVSGPRRIQAGACRDSLIGVRFVNGSGEVVKNGGRVMKNVTGYDLVKLMCGSYGTLGVLTELSFKLVPQPEDEATICVAGLGDATAVEALSAALASPFDVSGAAHVPGDADGDSTRTLIRVEGFAASVAYRADRLRELLGAFGESAIMGADDSRAIWRAVRDCEFFCASDRAVWRISVRPSHGPEVVASLKDAVDAAAYYDWGGGLVWLAVADEGDAGAAAIRAATARFGGHATLVRAASATRLRVDVFEPEPAAIAGLTRGIKSSFDPAGILNPGRMGH